MTSPNDAFLRLYPQSPVQVNVGVCHCGAGLVDRRGTGPLEQPLESGPPEEGGTGGGSLRVLT